MTTALEVYQETVRVLPLKEKLLLASLILRDAAGETQAEAAMNALNHYSDDWSDQDRHDVTLLILRRADELYPEEELV